MASPPSRVEGERLTPARLLPEAQALVIAQQVAEGLQGGLPHGFCHGGGCPMPMRVTAPHTAQLVDDCWHMPHALFAAKSPPDTPPPQDRVRDALRPSRAPESQHTAAGAQRADLYALGATLSPLLTGQSPAQVGSIVERLHGASRPADVLALHRVHPHVAPATSALVMAMLAHDPAQRLPEYRSVLTKLEACLLGLRIDQVRQDADAPMPRAYPPQRSASLYTCVSRVLGVTKIPQYGVCESRDSTTRRP